MTLEQTACEDLKAFERRLTEVINCLQPSTLRWRYADSFFSWQSARSKNNDRNIWPKNRRWNFTIIFLILVVLVVVSICTAVGAWFWITDPALSTISFSQSLWSHLFFTISSCILVLLFLCGIHKRVIAPSIIANRTRMVLSDFNMSCDESGKLILKPRPTVT